VIARSSVSEARCPPYAFEGLHKARLAVPQPLGDMPLAVLTASESDVTRLPACPIEDATKDHLRLQSGASPRSFLNAKDIRDYLQSSDISLDSNC
jgi:hypothetical protein